MRIRELRLARGWSQEQLAELTGLSVRTIQRLEGGQSAGLETLNALAAVFAVPLVELSAPPPVPETAMQPHDTPPLAPPLSLSPALRYRLIRYATVIGGLLLINLLTSPQHLWFLYPALIWGLILGLRVLRESGRFPLLGEAWSERAARKRARRDARSS
ncbi:helix-turn-helix domain-containing protein [Pseudomonas sp. UL073]|uniref:Helix-turn-helix domain-containing protein n=1 Tax=Zestomonas insulae TaxID=2809017 RepID=A0ABS2IA94_9GAMM|nr:helix-turn-helix domain-containing protein [Pseudomonas insulae]MBM7060061.1 helix-turn-helix domain-containing protein [Pseudomonas insulae]